MSAIAPNNMNLNLTRFGLDEVTLNAFTLNQT